MILKKFKLRDPESKKYFIVCIYDNLKSLVIGANEHNRKMGSKQPNDGIAGTANCYEKVKILPDRKEVISDEIGTIRLAKNRLHTEICTHELIHAALHQYRVEYGTEREFEGSGSNADFGNGCGKEEENFAYIYGRLFRDFTNKMYRYGFWKQS